MVHVKGNIDKTVEFVKEKMKSTDGGHDWWHIYRVWQNAKHIGEKEGGDMEVIEFAALLHDIADWKFQGGDSTVGPKVAREWLQNIGVEKETIDHVCNIVQHISYMGAGVENKISTLEGKIVQDADRLDALGAIGIARAFSYGGFKSRELYNPNIPPMLHGSAEEYKKNKSSSLNHFYEKLLLLKDRMNTKTGKAMAEERHTYMEEYVRRFLTEWEGKE
ncbi:HD domain-containing protein [Candidatus Parcubacteria bacterium]|nr:HD domain-containing protein [Candidatus Parcubacteria bacterium]